jgi:hypothetical protein
MAQLIKFKGGFKNVLDNYRCTVYSSSSSVNIWVL